LDYTFKRIIENKNFNYKNLDVKDLEYLFSRGYTVPYKYFERCILQDKLDIIQFFVSKGFQCDYNTLIKASKTGNLNIVKYLYETGQYHSDMLHQALELGFTDIVIYLYPKFDKSRFFVTRWTIERLIDNNHLGILKYLYTKNSEKHWFNVHYYCHSLIEYAAIHGSLDVIKFFLEFSSYTDKVMLNACEYKRFNVIKFLLLEAKMDPRPLYEYIDQFKMTNHFDEYMKIKRLPKSDERKMMSFKPRLGWMARSPCHFINDSKRYFYV
jgi:hypothetical protein